MREVEELGRRGSKEEGRKERREEERKGGKRQRDGGEGRGHEENSGKKKNQKVEGSSRDLKLKSGRVESQQGHESEDLGMVPLQVIPLLCDLDSARSLGLS